MNAASDETIAGLARVPTGVLADVLCEMGLPAQIVSDRIAPISGRPRFAGRAVCVAGRSDAQAKALPGPLPTMFDVDAMVGPGSVVVVDAGGHREGATIGGLVALAFRRAGAVGFVTDGGVRDRDELTEMGLPCLAGFVTPRSAKGVWSVTSVGAAIALPGQCGVPVSVATGDALCCDADGLVVVPAALTADVLRDALRLEAMERAILEAIESGGDRREAYRRNDRFGHIRKRA